MNIPKQGFLVGPAAEAMLAQMERRTAHILGRIGYEQRDSGWRREGIGMVKERKIAVPNTSVLLDPASKVARLSQTPGVGDVQDQQTGLLWSTFTLAPATAFPQTTTLFQSPVSATNPLSATNLRDQGKLAYPERMDVYYVHLFFLNNIALPDLLAVYTNVTFTLVLNGNFPKLETLAWHLPAGGGAHITGGNQVGTAPVGAAVYHATGNGVPDINNCFNLPDVIQLGAGEQLVMNVQNWTPFNTSANTTNPPGTGITMVMAFRGARFRPVGA